MRTEHGPISATPNKNGYDIKNVDLNDYPGNFLLRQNYPNPFNPKTKISFDIPKVREDLIHVNISIHSIIHNLFPRFCILPKDFMFSRNTILPTMKDKVFPFFLSTSSFSFIYSCCHSLSPPFL